jgi:hypothetical protein
MSESDATSAKAVTPACLPEVAAPIVYHSLSASSWQPRIDPWAPCRLHMCHVPRPTPELRQAVRDTVYGGKLAKSEFFDVDDYISWGAEPREDSSGDIRGTPSASGMLLGQGSCALEAQCEANKEDVTRDLLAFFATDRALRTGLAYEVHVRVLFVRYMRSPTGF